MNPMEWFDQDYLELNVVEGIYSSGLGDKEYLILHCSSKESKYVHVVKSPWPN